MWFGIMVLWGKENLAISQAIVMFNRVFISASVTKRTGAWFRAYSKTMTYIIVMPTTYFSLGKVAEASASLFYETGV